MTEPSGSSEPHESPERVKPVVPDLEPRRDRAKAAPKDIEPEGATAAFGAVPTLDEELARRAAIYLIEREAIELRRQQWVDLYQSQTRPGDVESEAPPRGPTPEPRPELGAADRARLAKYDRPKAPDGGEAAPSRMGRVGSWLKSIFIGG